MTETQTDIKGEKRLLNLKVRQADIGDKEELAESLLDLTKKQIKEREKEREKERRLDELRKRMKEAADAAEESGVGTGGKGSRDD